MIKSFTELTTWKKSHILVLDIYFITKSFPKNEIYSLTNQMRRCAVSITSNIAEGFSRKSYKEKLHFYSIASGSLSELKNQLLIARDIHYINRADYDGIVEKAHLSHKLLHGLISKTKQYSQSNLQPPTSIIYHLKWKRLPHL